MFSNGRTYGGRGYQFQKQGYPLPSLISISPKFWGIDPLLKNSPNCLLKISAVFIEKDLSSVSKQIFRLF
jgi:hypothetical protein